ACEQTAVNLWMQRLEPPIEHLGESGVGGDLGDRDAFFREQPGRAAGGEQSHAQPGEGAGQLDEAGLVGNAEQRSLDLDHYPLIRSCCIFLRSVLRLMPSISAASDWLPAALSSTVSIIGFSMFLSTMS